MRGADLSSGEWPYLWLDATYVPCREAGAPRSVALVTAVACSSSARRRVVGVECIDTRVLPVVGAPSCCRSGPRGLSGVRLVTSDAHEGLVRAVREALPGARLAALHRPPRAQRARALPQEGRRVGGRRGAQGRLRRGRPRARARRLPPCRRAPRRRRRARGRSCSRTPPRRRSPTSRSRGSTATG